MHSEQREGDDYGRRLHDTPCVGGSSGKDTSREEGARKAHLASLVEYVAEKNGLARKEAKQVMEDIFELVATGVMRGERVAIGKMGKMFIRVRPARAGPDGKESAKRRAD